MKRRMRTAAAVALGLVAVGLGARGVAQVRQHRRALATCGAVERGDWPAAIAVSAGLRPGSGPDLDALGCRCRALAETGGDAACLAEVEAALAVPDGAAWVPPAWLIPRLVERWRAQGQDARAADLLARAGRALATDSSILLLEYQVRSEVEGEVAVLADYESRLAEPGATDALRLRAAQACRRRNDARLGLQILGEEPPAEPRSLDAWFQLKVRLHAHEGDVGAARATVAAWRDAGASPDTTLVYYAAALAESVLQDPGIPPAELLAAAVAAAARIDDPATEEYLARTLINQLVADGRHAEAVEVFERARQRLPLEGVTRQGIELSQIQREVGAAGNELPRGGVRFTMAGSLPGARLAVSPDADGPADAAYEEFDPGAAGVALERRLGHAPVRWVLRDGDGALRSSGTLWPRPGGVRDVRVQVGPALHREPPIRPDPRPADGRPRLLVLVIDCMDWRIARYLMARGEMPAFAGLLERGWSAVLWSDPPYTSTAMDFLVHPDQGSKASVVGVAHDIGGELVDMVPSGKNPFAFLYWLMPEQEDIFGTLGSGPLRVANMLFSHGVIEAGRHGEVSGPHGQRGEPLAVQAFRPLSEEETAREPALGADPNAYRRQLFQETAGMMDAAVWMLTESDLDLLMMRVVPMDRLTHLLFNAATAEGQDDGQSLLLAYYRYIDQRLADVLRALDDDDRLVFMSDHGIRTSVEHDNPAIFVLVGPGVPVGRAPGTPHLRGVPRSVADLLGVATEWPDTGITPWIRER